MNDVLRLDDVAVGFHPERMFRFPFGDLIVPRIKFWLARAVGELRFQLLQKGLHGKSRIAYDRIITRNVFADAGRINVYVNELCAFGEFAQLAGDAIIEARAD